MSRNYGREKASARLLVVGERGLDVWDGTQRRDAGKPIPSHQNPSDQATSQVSLPIRRPASVTPKPPSPSNQPPENAPVAIGKVPLVKNDAVLVLCLPQVGGPVHVPPTTPSSPGALRSCHGKGQRKQQQPPPRRVGHDCCRLLRFSDALENQSEAKGARRGSVVGKEVRRRSVRSERIGRASCCGCTWFLCKARKQVIESQSSGADGARGSSRGGAGNV